jgi:hypothetical protein
MLMRSLAPARRLARPACLAPRPGLNRPLAGLQLGSPLSRCICAKPPTSSTAKTAPAPVQPESKVEEVRPPSLADGTWPYILSKKAITVEDPDSFPRWLMPTAGGLVHMSIGSVYAWSVWNTPLTMQLGVVAQSANDWSLAFTVAHAYGAAFALTGLGAQMHSLGLMYAGYGVLGGFGWGLGYLSPVSTLMRWFPERKGLAAGLALTCFGMGAAIGAPLINMLIERNFVPPTYLGRAADVTMTMNDGVTYADHLGSSVEVVVATAAELARLPGALQEGVYVVGTGDTGVSSAMFTLAATYYCTIMAGAFAVRVPTVDWWPAHAPKSEEDAALATSPSIDYNAALRTPQYLLFLSLIAGNAFAGMILISSAKTIMTDIFAAAMPAVVTSSFAAGYVSSLGLANSGGRAGWAFASDYLGSKNTYYTFGLGVPIVGSIPMIAQMVSTGDGFAGSQLAPLYLFYGGTLATISFYGGNFSCLPPYLAKTFGPQHMGAIHGRVLSAWAFSAFCGPKVLSFLRERSNSNAIDELVALCPPEHFETAFGAPVTDLAMLKETNAVTIARLMELVPPGTPDPTPMLYNDACYVVCGLLAMSIVANGFIRPVPR